MSSHRDKPNMSQLWLKSVANPESGQLIYYDAKLQGSGIRLTQNKRAYIVEKRLPGGQLRRLKIGDAAYFSPEQARREAQIKLGEMVSGVDPVQEKRAKVLMLRRLRRHLPNISQLEGTT